MENLKKKNVFNLNFLKAGIWWDVYEIFIIKTAFVAFCFYTLNSFWCRLIQVYSESKRSVSEEYQAHATALSVGKFVCTYFPFLFLLISFAVKKFCNFFHLKSRLLAFYCFHFVNLFNFYSKHIILHYTNFHEYSTLLRFH